MSITSTFSILCHINDEVTEVSNQHPLPSGGGAQGSSGPAAGWGKNFQGGGGGQDNAYS